MKNTTLKEIDEGSLEWVRLNGIINKSVYETSKEIIQHYGDVVNPNEKICVGSMKFFNGEFAITWGVLQDWEEGYEDVFA